MNGNKTENKSVFNGFTNLYSLTKTLRFELKPTIETNSLRDVIDEDEKIDKLYNEEMKPMFNKLHERFINESLQNAKLSGDIMEKLEKIYQKNIKEKNKAEKNEDKDTEKLQEELRKEVVKLFDNQGEKWKNKDFADINLKNNNHEILTEKSALQILKKLNPDKEKIIEKFKKFFTYFSGFNQNRENYYSGENKSTSIANRIVNENLYRFFENRQKFNDFLKNIPQFKNYEKVFLLESYNKCLNQIGIEKFNENIGELNKETNLFCQQKKNFFIKTPKFKNLYKQIGCGKKIFDIFQIEEGKEWRAVSDLIYSQNKKIKLDLKEKKLIEGVKDLYKKFFNEQNDFDLNAIYFNKTSLNTVSSMWFVNWRILSDALASKKAINTRNKNRETGEYSIPKKISLADIRRSLETEKNSENLFKSGRIDAKSGKGEYEALFKENAWLTFLSIWQHEVGKNFLKLNENIKEFKKIKNKEFNKKDHTRLIKKICDSFLAIERMIKYHGVGEENEKDDVFYETVDAYVQETVLNQYYNAFRNHLAKKSFSKNKIKLNFENGSLLGGFSDGQEKNKGAVIIRNEEKIYLGILTNRGFFRTDKENKVYVEHSKWERLILNNLKFQTLAGKGFLGKFKKSYGDIGKKDPMLAVKRLQEFVRDNYLKKYPKLRDVVEKNYETKKEFDNDIKKALENSFDMSFRPIDEYLLNQGVKKGELYLFEILNKDLVNLKKEGNKNSHSIYWLELFSSKNLQDIKFILNGGGEIFFRKGQPDKLDKKKDKKGKEVLDAKRYAEDKIFLHIPITINYGKPANIKFKSLINNFLKTEREKINILGIDRGEKHLLYYSLISQNGEIIKQGSFNQIKTKNETNKKKIVYKYEDKKEWSEEWAGYNKLENIKLKNTEEKVEYVDYRLLLDYYEKKRILARKSWDAIGKIKDLKEGYLSQVVFEIYKLAISKNAIIILENLNNEFKIERTAKFEKAVYKNFELNLAKKLNHVILKDKTTEEIGGALNAYQLTPPVNKMKFFEKAKQWGVMFYVRSNHTSITDPVTGWRKKIYISNSETLENIKKKWKETGIRIFFDDNEECYGFDCGEWTLRAHKKLERYYWSRNEKNSEGERGSMRKYNLRDEFVDLFSGMDVKKINEEIYSKSDFHWKNLIFFWNLLNQIRNSDKTKDEDKSDFLQSPIWSEKINDYYDSRKKYEVQLPTNGDANGAYNIARKGAMILKRIKENPENPDLFITNSDWDDFVRAK